MKVETIKINDHEQVSLTSYIQDLSNELKNVHKRPAILIFPGGGYEFCSDREAEPIALKYLAAGYNAFVLRYSLKKESRFPKPLRDAEDALKYLKGHAKELNIYEDKIAVIGFSAGGHLASMLATKGVVRPNAVILGYPAILKQVNWDYPVPKVDALTPEMFLFHTFEDTIVSVEHTLTMASMLSKSAIPFECHIFKKGVHGLSLGNEIVSNGHDYMIEKDYQIWFDLSLKWLSNVLDVYKI
ncbi:MAG: alpha/beta hydrolase [Candidatus Izemoplasmataceae bacterium]